MKGSESDVYGEVADILSNLQDTVEAYISSLPVERNASNNTGAATTTASLAHSTSTEQVVTRQYIESSLPQLLASCVSVAGLLRQVVSLTPSSAPPTNDRVGSLDLTTGHPRSQERGPTVTAARQEALRVLVTRKLGDVMENARNMQGVVTRQQKRQPKLAQPFPIAGSSDGDDTLRMKRLLRVTLYNLEDTERLLRIAYPDGPGVHRTRANEEEPSPEQVSSTQRGSSGSSGDGSRGVPSLTDTPRGSTQTAPYARRSPSLDPASLSREGRRESPQHREERLEEGEEAGRGRTATPPTHVYHPSSILARSARANVTPKSASAMASASRTSLPRVHFALDEIPETVNKESSLASSSSSLADVSATTATPPPQQHLLLNRCDLLSNSVVRRGSTDNEDSGLVEPSQQQQQQQQLLLRSDVSGNKLMQLASFPLQRSLHPAEHLSITSSASPASASVTAAEVELPSSTAATPSLSEAPELSGQLHRRGAGPRASAATPSVLSLGSISAAEAPGSGPEVTPPSRVSSSNGVACRTGDEKDDATNSVDRNGVDASPTAVGLSSSPMQSSTAPKMRLVGNSWSSLRVLPPAGLPPRSPRQQEIPLPTGCVPPLGESHLPSTGVPPTVDSNARVASQHIHRIPGELWGAIIEEHRDEVEDVLCDDVVDLFNYGEAVPLLHREDVKETYLTVVDSHLYIRMQIEHAVVLTEAEINMRLALSSYPLITNFYEKFFNEYRAKEFDPIEDSLTTLGSGTLRGSVGGHSSPRDGERQRARRGGEEQVSVNLDELLIAEATMDLDDSARISLSPTVGTAGTAAAVLDSQEVSVAENSSASSSSTSLSPLGDNYIPDGALPCKDSAEAEARHTHVVHVPGAHWSKLLAPPAECGAAVQAAFVADIGLATGVLPSEARAACQEIEFSFGSLVIRFTWDNRELYPGATPLTAEEVEAVVAKCPYRSVRTVYADACTTMHLENDLAASPAGKVGSAAVAPLSPSAVRPAPCSAPTADHTPTLSPRDSVTERVKATAPYAPLTVSTLTRRDSGASDRSTEEEPRTTIPKPLTGTPTLSQNTQHHENPAGGYSVGVGGPPSLSPAGQPSSAAPTRSSGSGDAQQLTPSPASASAPTYPVDGRRPLRSMSEGPPMVKQETTANVPEPPQRRRASQEAADKAAARMARVAHTKMKGSEGAGVATPLPIDPPPLSSSKGTSPSPSGKRNSAAGEAAMQRDAPAVEAVYPLAPPPSATVVDPGDAGSIVVERLALQKPATKSSTLQIDSTGASAAHQKDRNDERGRTEAVGGGSATHTTVPIPPATAAIPEVSPKISANSLEPSRKPVPATASPRSSSQTRVVYRLPETKLSHLRDAANIDLVQARNRVSQLLRDTWTADDAAMGEGGDTVSVEARSDDEEKDSVDEEVARTSVTPQREWSLGLRLDGLRVIGVRHGSPAVRAGVRAGDTLRALDGARLFSSDDVGEVIARIQAQQRGSVSERKVPITVESRSGVPATYWLRLPPLPTTDATVGFRSMPAYTLSQQRALQQASRYSLQPPPLTAPRQTVPQASRPRSQPSGSVTASTLEQPQRQKRPVSSSSRAPTESGDPRRARWRVGSICSSTRAMSAHAGARGANSREAPNMVRTGSLAVAGMPGSAGRLPGPTRPTTHALGISGSSRGEALLTALFPRRERGE